MLDRLKTIAARRGLSLGQAANQIGVSLRQLRRILDRDSFGSIDVWCRIIQWSRGELTPNDLFEAEIRAAREVRAGQQDSQPEQEQHA